jgi:hypothetical protein
LLKTVDEFLELRFVVLLEEGRSEMRREAEVARETNLDLRLFLLDVPNLVVVKVHSAAIGEEGE